MQNKNNNLKKNIYYIIDIYIYIYVCVCVCVSVCVCVCVWSSGPKSYNWVLGFGWERGALGKSVRSPNPRRNISSDKLNADQV